MFVVSRVGYLRDRPLLERNLEIEKRTSVEIACGPLDNFAELLELVELVVFGLSQAVKQ